MPHPYQVAAGFGIGLYLTYVGSVAKQGSNTATQQ